MTSSLGVSRVQAPAPKCDAGTMLQQAYDATYSWPVPMLSPSRGYGNSCTAGPELRIPCNFWDAPAERIRNTRLKGRPVTVLQSRISRPKLLRMAQTETQAVDCIRVLSESGSNLVAEVLRGNAEFTEWEHYPPNDVCDPETHAQYYFHAHAVDDRERADYAHFHTFLRSKRMPAGIRLAPVPGLVPPTGDNDALSHLIAISNPREGMPERLFSTNRWVTGETWYTATDVIAMLDHFIVDPAYPSRPLNQWLTAMLVLFRPQIEQLLLERDRAIARCQAEHPGQDVFEDRRLEITSAVDISLRQQIEWLDRLLDGSEA
jgi:hypothetical protein